MTLNAPTPTLVTTQSFSQRFWVNVEAQLRSGSTWAAGALLAILSILSEWPDAAAAFDSIPVLHGHGLAIAGVIAILVAKFKPSTALTSQSQALAVELWRVKMNEYLRAHGAPEIPEDPAITAKLPQLPAPVPTMQQGWTPTRQLPPSPAPAPEPMPTWAATQVEPPPPAPAPAPSLVDPMFTVIKAIEPTVPDDVIAAAVKRVRDAKRAPGDTDIPLPIAP